MLILALALFAIGFLVRDGYPPLGHTQLARLSGAFIAAAGALVVYGFDPIVVYIGVAVMVSFFADQFHAAGQGGRTLKDAFYLSISGLTSMVPLTAVLVAVYDWHYVAVLLLGLTKPAIWFFWWRTPIQDVGPWFQPTRFAAMSFGVVSGFVAISPLLV